MAISLRDQAPNKSKSKAPCAGLVINVSTAPVGSDHQADVIRGIRAGQRDLSAPFTLQGSAQELRNGKSDGQGDVEEDAFSSQLLKVYQKARTRSRQQFTNLTREALKVGPGVNGAVVRTFVSAVLGKGDRANQHDRFPETRPFRSIGNPFCLEAEQADHGLKIVSASVVNLPEQAFLFPQQLCLLQGEPFLAHQQGLKPLLGLDHVRDVDAGAEVAAEGTIGTMEGTPVVEQPAVLTVMAPQPVGHRELFPGIEGSDVNRDTSVIVVRMNTLGPAEAEFLLHCAAGKSQPGFVEEIAHLVEPGAPDHDGRVIRQQFKLIFAGTMINHYSRPLRHNCITSKRARHIERVSGRTKLMYCTDQSYHWGSMQTSLIDLAPAAAASSTSEDDERHSASRIEHTRRLRLVIVEDDAVASMNLEAILEELGHEICDVASTASAAVRMAEQHRPELILMDIRLARGSSGIEAACTIRDSLDIPSIFVTAHDDAATIGQAMAARPLGFVTKPYTSREIAAALAEALSSPHGLC